MINYNAQLIRQRDLQAQHGGTLIQALINGYTVEQELTTEDKMEAKLIRLLEQQGITSPLPVGQLAELLTLAVREVLAEERQMEY